MFILTIFSVFVYKHVDNFCFLFSSTKYKKALVACRILICTNLNIQIIPCNWITWYTFNYNIILFFTENLTPCYSEPLWMSLYVSPWIIIIVGVSLAVCKLLRRKKRSRVSTIFFYFLLFWGRCKNIIYGWDV